jgi:uncharacterized protein YoxC
MRSTKKPLEPGVLVSLVAAGLALIGTIVSLAVLFGRYSQKVSTLETGVQSLQPRIYESETTVANLGARISSLEKNVQYMSDKADKLTEEVTSMGVRVNPLPERINRSEKTVASLGARISSLEKNVQHVSDKADKLTEEVTSMRVEVNLLPERINGLEKIVYRLGGQEGGSVSGTVEGPTVLSEGTEPPPAAADESVIPLDAAWKCEGSIANDGGGHIDGKLQLKADLTHADNSAELFLDLGSVPLAGIKPNQDGSYNLAGMELVALVRSDQDFKGQSNASNGVQFLVKDKNWKSRVGPWSNVTPAMESETGMKVFYKIPDAEISRNVAGISLKFTINSESRATYKGSFFVHSVKIKMK